MEQLHTNISQLEAKLIQLKTRYDQQKLLIERLQKENRQLKDMSATKKQPFPLIYNQEEHKASFQQLNLERGSIQELLEQYIQQINQCIDFLEKLM